MEHSTTTLLECVYRGNIGSETLLELSRRARNCATTEARLVTVLEYSTARDRALDPWFGATDPALSVLEDRAHDAVYFA